MAHKFITRQTRMYLNLITIRFEYANGKLYIVTGNCML